MSEGEFTEFGVNYTRNKKIAKELGYQRFDYLGKHLLTGNIFNRTVYCRDRESFKLLLAGWNIVQPIRWSYTEK